MKGALQSSSHGQLRFEVDAALLFELGEQLVTRNSVALAELVKNGYDADASEVIVKFDDVRKSGGTITVQDDGSGMPFEVVRDQWMRIATTDKARREVSDQLRRPLTGAKGVGRFAARRLARTLNLTTTAKRPDGDYERTHISFDWDDFRAGSELVDVLTTYRTEVLTDVRTGTTLELQDVREAWDEDDIAEAQDDLRSLTPPFTSFVLREPGQRIGRFEVKFIAPEFPERQGSLTEGFLSAAVARLRGSVADDGSPRYEVVLRGGGTTVFEPQGFKLSELPGAVAEIHFFKYDRTSLSGTGLGVGTARTIGTSAGGVRIYLDGFRVFPYGDTGDDWLDLDADRGRRRTGVDPVVRAALPTGMNVRPLLQLPGNNNLFGAVFVTRVGHRGLRPTISRERLASTIAFDQLKSFARIGIEYMVVQRARMDSRERNKKARPGNRSVLATLAVGIAAARTEIAGLPEQHRPRLKEAIDKLEHDVREADAEQLEKASALRVLASSGTMVLIFVHQLRAALDGLNTAVEDLRDEGLSLEIADELEEWTELMEAQSAELGLLMGKRARREERLAVSPVAEQIVGVVAGYAKDHGVSIENAVAPGVRTPPMRSAELHAVLLNLMSNALKAVRSSEDRRIRVGASRTPTGLELTVSDTGHGIRKRDWERSFEPFETTSDPDPVLGVGTGLGLTIVRDLAEQHGGTAAFIDPEPGWSTTVRVTIPSEIQ